MKKLAVALLVAFVRVPVLAQEDKPLSVAKDGKAVAEKRFDKMQIIINDLKKLN